VVSYVGKMQTRRQVYRLKQNGVWIGDYKTVDELVEDAAGGSDDPPPVRTGMVRHDRP
jgi:hypothetical protein